MSILSWWRDDTADYVQAIQILKTEKPLALPAIQQLRAKRVPPAIGWNVVADDPDQHLGAVRP